HHPLRPRRSDFDPGTWRGQTRTRQTYRRQGDAGKDRRHGNLRQDDDPATGCQGPELLPPVGALLAGDVLRQSFIRVASRREN
ncbi:MAG: hypothetical protein ACK56I_04850, partial [bacterium]